MIDKFSVLRDLFPIWTQMSFLVFFICIVALTLKQRATHQAPLSQNLMLFDMCPTMLLFLIIVCSLICALILFRELMQFASFLSQDSWCLFHTSGFYTSNILYSLYRHSNLKEKIYPSYLGREAQVIFCSSWSHCCLISQSFGSYSDQ